jgi:phage portal protein BeeE
MSLDFELGGDKYRAEYDSNELSTAKETYEQYLSAGILFPEEVRNAERVLSRLKLNAVSQIWSMPASEKIPA